MSGEVYSVSDSTHRCTHCGGARQLQQLIVFQIKNGKTVEIVETIYNKGNSDFFVVECPLL